MSIDVAGLETRTSVRPQWVFTQADSDQIYPQPRPYYPRQVGRSLTDAHFSAAEAILGTSLMPVAITENWQRIQTSNLSLGALRRIFEIANLRPGWRGASSAALSASSLKYFLNFWALVRASALEPNITLVPKGRLKALWLKDPSNLLDIQFCEDGSVIYGLFRMGKIHEGVGSPADVHALLRAGNADVLR
jgi:hypothetical protein